MGRKRKVSHNEFVDCIRRHSECFMNDTMSDIQPSGHEIWTKIAEDLHFKYKPATIFLHLYNNRDNIMGLLGRRQVSNEQLSLDVNDGSGNGIVDSTTDDAVEHDEEWSFNEEQHSNGDCVKFQFEIGGNDWVQMKPVAKTYGRRECTLRNQLILPKGVWTTLFEHHFWKATQICCPVTYDSGRVFVNGLRYILIKGHCKVCKSQLSAHVVNEPMPDQTSVMFEGRYSGAFKNCYTLQQPMKRRITPEQKQHFIPALVKDRIPGSIVRDKYADRMMNFGDPEPPYIPLDSSLRSLKSRELKKQRMDDDPIMGVFRLKHGKYRTSISSLGYDKFFVHYWTAAEIALYREYVRKNSNCPTICIDATGSLIKKPKYYSFREFSDILYYAIVVNDKNSCTQFAVAHMFSERHDNNAITFWLEDWVRSKVPYPKQVVTDMSLALMSAVVKTFTPYDSLWAYIDGCFDIIQNNGKNSLGMPCLIRNDVAHIMKIITSWKPFDKVDGRAKEFICCSMGQIVLCECMDEVEDLLRNLFWVINSEMSGKDPTTGDSTYSEVGIHFLRQKIATGTAHCNMAAFLENCAPEHGDPAYTDLFPTSATNRDVANCFYVSTSVLANRCRLDVGNENGDHLNIFYLPAIIPMILDLCAYLPLWSGIMCKKVGFGDVPPSSAPVESNFAVLKRRIFKNQDLPMRVDDFMALHLDALSGKNCLNYARLLRTRTSNPDAIVNSNLNSSQNSNDGNGNGSTSENQNDGNGSTLENPNDGNGSTLQNPNDGNGRTLENPNDGNGSTLENPNDSLLHLNHSLMMEADAFCMDGPEPLENDDNISTVSFDGNGHDAGYNSEVVGNSACSSVEYEVVRNSAVMSPELDVVTISSESSIENEVVNNSVTTNVFYHRSVTEIPNTLQSTFDDRCDVDDEDEVAQTSTANPNEVVRGAIQNMTNNSHHEHIEPSTYDKHNKSYEQDAIEGWSKKRPRQNRRSYLTPKAELLRANLKTRTKRKLIGLLRNGGNVQLKGISMLSEKFTFTNTCGFDSVTQIMAVAYCDSDVYACYVTDLAHEDTFWDLVQSLSVYGVISASYIKRGKILYTLFSQRIVYQLYSLTIDAACTSDELVRGVFDTQVSIALCGMCNTVIDTRLVYPFIHSPMAVSRVTSDWLKEKMIIAIDTWMEQIIRCNECGSSETVHIQLIPHIIFTVICFDETNIFHNDVSSNITVKLSNIPKLLHIHNIEYILRGVMTTPIDQNLKTLDENGHYIACCYREPYKAWEVYDDLKTQGTRIKANTAVAVEMFIYTR